MTLTNKHLKDVCLLHHHDVRLVCRYLRNDELDHKKWYCQKLQSQIKESIDNYTASRSDTPMGDNCSGYPLLKHVPQGYDV